jgi:hypothetical protein
VVGTYDYDANHSIVSVIDRRTRKVLTVRRAPVRFQLSDAERAEAAAVAARNPRVKAFLGGDPMNPLIRLYFPPPRRRYRSTHRFAIVFLRPSHSRRQYAIVDLSDRRVVDVLTRRDLTGA